MTFYYMWVKMVEGFNSFKRYTFYWQMHSVCSLLFTLILWTVLAVSAVMLGCLIYLLKG